MTISPPRAHRSHALLTKIGRWQEACQITRDKLMLRTGTRSSGAPPRWLRAAICHARMHVSETVQIASGTQWLSLHSPRCTVFAKPLRSQRHWRGHGRREGRLTLRSVRGGAVLRQICVRARMHVRVGAAIGIGVGGAMGDGVVVGVGG
eukprot:6189826-Pleurochrysis_carterae.AAC.1